jgi:hypothetical protein
MQLLRRPGFQDGETCQGESVSASLTDLASQDPANFAQADPILPLKSMAPVAARNVGTRRTKCHVLFRRVRKSGINSERFGRFVGRILALQATEVYCPC